MASTLDRRGFLGIAAGLTAAIATGCSTTQQAAAPSAPKAGGLLRAVFAGGGAKEVLDPHLANLFVEYARSKAIYDKLADFGDDLKPVPRLAERWEAGKDATTWRVHLRKALFHNGKPVRAADVLASYARIADPKGTFRAKASLAVIDLANSRAVDDRTIEFALRRPFVEFPNVLAAFGAHIIPEGTTDFTTPIGSGPFAFAAFQPGVSTTLKRFADHWDGVPHLDELRFVIANEESARVNAVLGGQAEYAHDLAPTTARTHESGGRLTVVRSPLSGMSAFAMKLDRPPFDNRDLREAMFLLVDRPQLVETVLGGSGQVGNDLFGKGYQYYADDLPQRTRDLDRAKSLVRKAGAEGMTIKLDTSTAATGFVEAASLLVEQAKQVGLTLEVAMGNKDTYWADTLKNGSLSAYRSGAMPIEAHLSQRLLTNSPTNVTKFARPEFDALYHETMSTTDETKRAELYRRMQRIQHDDGGLLVWGFADWLVGTKANVGGIVAKAPANTLNWARFDKVWLG